MSASGVKVVFNDFPLHARLAHSAGERLVAETAKAIETEVTARWSWNHIPVGIRRAAGENMNLSVVAGNRSRFHSIFLEYGTSFQSARPALVPAAERAKLRFFSEARRIVRRMR